MRVRPGPVLTLSYGPSGAYSTFRSIHDLRVEPLVGDAVNVLVAVDAGEEFETYTDPTLNPVNPVGTVDDPVFFEIDCHDGLSDDAGGGDALVDFADPDCGETLQALILRLPYDALGSGLSSPSVEVLFSGFR